MKIAIIEFTSNYYRPYHPWINWHHNIFSLYNTLSSMNTDCHLIGIYDYSFFNIINTYESRFHKILLKNFLNKNWYIRSLRIIPLVEGYYSLVRFIIKNNINAIMLTVSFNPLINRLIETLKNFGIKMIYWDVEAYFDPFLSKNADIILTTRKKIPELDIDKPVIFFPFFTDTNIFKPLKLKKDFDISFVGVIKDKRKDFLLPIIKKYKKRVLLVGSNFDSDFNIATKFPFMDYDYLNLIYNKSKISINILIEESIKMHGFNQRTFEILGSKTFLVTTGRHHEDLFKDKKHLVIAETPKEMLEVIDYYLENEEERERIAEEGYREILNKHTEKHRAKEFIEILDKYI